MANIELKRGQKAQVDITFKEAGQTNAKDFSSGFTASLVLRKKSSGGSVEGDVIDKLTSSENRITFTHANAGPNIQLKWSTLQARDLPNENLTIFGDLKIVESNEVVHSFRLTFDIIPEII
tara:strand:+ start:154 stop:516 length:363 start_codon:yes stop_codon:yes gene_type:complete